MTNVSPSITPSSKGLTQAEVAARLKTYGPNRVSTRSVRTAIGEFLHLVSDPQALMLLALAAVYFLIQKPIDGWIMLGAVVPILAISAALDLRTRKALRALHAAWRPWVHVVREGKVIRIASEDVVPDDVLVLEEGEWLPADGVVLESVGLTADESSMSGESAPVSKAINSKFFAGTMVLTGKGLGRVTATGVRSNLGNLSTLVLESENVRSPIQKLIRRIVWKLALLAVLVSAGVLGLEIWRYGFSGETVVRALTVAMSIIPEEFPVVFTLFLSLGAWRLSKRGILIRDLPSVETLGRTTVLCTDKTGTLTEGRFQLTDVVAWPPEAEMTPALWDAVVMSCEPQVVDPLEKAMLERAVTERANSTRVASTWRLIEDPPFDPVTKTMFHVWENDQGVKLRVSKGAFEGISAVCKWDTPQDSLRASQHVDAMTKKGLRVLALSVDFKLAALLGFSDPVRPGVSEALALCRRAGIDVRVVTGDDLRTARVVADAVGLTTDHASVTGPQLKALKNDQRERAYLNSVLFARVLPEQKYELVTTLRKAGEVVAVTGDGVNDAPALKAADIGISMGARATELARASARMVLIHDDFGSLVTALIEGRKIFANLSRVFSYLVAFHVPLAVVSLGVPLMGWPAVILPIHILVLELVLHPVMALLFETAVGKTDDEWLDAEASSHALMTRTGVIRAIITGAVAAAVVLGVVAWSVAMGNPEGMSRAYTFAAIMTVNFALCLIELNGGEPIWKWTWKRGRRFWLVNAAIFALVMLGFYFPPFANIMKLTPLPWTAWGAIGLVTAVVLSWRWLGLGFKTRS